MSFNYYKISRHGSDEHKFMSKWTSIVDFVEIYGHIEISNYLKLENSFIKFLKMFYDFFTQPFKSYGYTSLAFNIIISEDLDSNRDSLLYYGMTDTAKRLNKLSKLNLNSIAEDDVSFLFKCWVRGLCSLYFFDIVTNSSLKPMEDDFYFSLILQEDIELNEIFSYVDGVHVYVDFDHYTSNESYIPPINIGEKIKINTPKESVP